MGLSCQFEVRQSQQAVGKSAFVGTLLNVQTNTSPPGGSSAKKINTVFPSKAHFQEVIEIFFANQYSGIFPFIHRPSFLEFLRSEDFVPSTYIRDYNLNGWADAYASSLLHPDPALLLSILALCSRLHPAVSKAYGNFSEDESPESFVPNWSGESSGNTIDLATASNALKYFGWHARQRLKEVFDKPTLQRVQAFAILSSHEWGEGNTTTSFLYIGLAARMALLLGFASSAEVDMAETGKIKEITLESRRRTVWTLYMMDRCNSSGRQRSPAMRIEDILIPLPASEEDFQFGNPSLAMTYQELESNLGKQLPHARISPVGFTALLFGVWVKITQWVGEKGAKNEAISPWHPNSPFYQLRGNLDGITNLLPLSFQLTSYNLKMRMELGTATHFGYFHGLMMLSRIFLFREYLFCDPSSFPAGWWKRLTLELLDSLEQFSSMVKMLRSNDMMVIAPFTGFEVFTCAVTLFYFCAFPNDILLRYLSEGENGIGRTIGEVEAWKLKYRGLALDDLEVLSTWSEAWELGRKWLKVTVNLGIHFGQLQKNSEKLDLDDLRASLHDHSSKHVPEVGPPRKSPESNGIVSRSEYEPSPEETAPLNKPREYTLDDVMSYEIASTKTVQPLSMPEFSFAANNSSIYPSWFDDDALTFVFDI